MHNAIVMKLRYAPRFCPARRRLAGAARPARRGRRGRAAFALPTAKGETVALDKLRGKVVYVDFWASWCGPCRRSFPWMNEMQRKYGPRGFVDRRVNVDKKREDAERFLAQNPAEFTIVFDEAGATPAAYAVKGMPSSYLVDARGPGRRSSSAASWTSTRPRSSSASPRWSRRKN